MKRPLTFALILALPLELASFLIMPFPLDVGLPDNANLFIRRMGLRWVLMHWIGLQMSRSFDGHDSLVEWAIIIGGYLEIAALLFLALLGLRAFGRSAQAERRDGGQG